MYESIFFKKKTLVLAQNKHQAKFAKIGEDLGYNEFFGCMPNVNIELLNERINNPKIYKNESKIDHKGKLRIKNKIEKLILQ